MPCNSDHMEANGYERSLTAVYQLLDELDGRPFGPEAFGNGYDKRAYNKATVGTLDEKTRELCDRLKAVDVTKYSLEMQLWWRDHHLADKARLEREAQEATLKELREQAIEKLTPEERSALGIDEYSLLR